MDVKHAGAVDNLWNRGRAGDLSQLEALAYRSNLLGTDRSVANYGGGNTSVKTTDTDHTGREIEVMWVKGSGSDLSTIKAGGFTGLKLEEILPLMERDEMSDEEMVAYLAKCQLGPTMPRSSIETLLHAFVPHPHVDHTHADAVNMICAAEYGEELARECFGDEAVWIPYIRPGFTLSKQVGEAVRDNPHARLVLLAKHGLVNWGETAEECYEHTIEIINQAAEFVAEKSAGKEPFGGRRVAPLPDDKREDLLATVLPALRGAVSGESPKILRTDTSDDVMEFVCGEKSPELSQVGAACPDHLVQTKVRPLWIEFDPESEGAEDLKERLVQEASRYREEYEAYFSRHEEAEEEMNDPNPRVVLIQGIGLVSVGADYKSSGLARDFYHRAIAVMRGASTMDSFTSLDEHESYAVEYWPMELYKLTLKPAPKELEGRVALVTGGAGGIGGATARALDALGAYVVVADLDEAGAASVVEDLGNPGLSAVVDVTDEEQVAAAYHRAVLAYGGIDIVVSNAGLASGAPVEETSVELWERDHAVLAKGYFLVAREAFRTLKEQGIGGSVIFVASKNSLAAGKNASAYSTAKAAELHLARCLAEEGGAAGIRVNTVNPDAVLQDSKIWGSSWREERAEAYGIDPDELEEHYRQRTTLKVNVYAEDIAEAVLHFASNGRSPKSTGNILNVDGGVKEAYPR
jgi:rhamnulose-1-phosphate aldolase/alcohol dehydrogenase